MNEILRSLSEFKTKGSEYIFKTCPFCNGGQSNDKYKFFVNFEKETYICFRGKCGVKGHLNELRSHLGLQIKIEKESYKNMSNTATKSATKPIESKKIADIKLSRLQEGDKGYKYLQLRKISKETIEYFKVSKDKNNNIAFPFYHNEKLKCIKYRIPQKVEKGNLKTWQETGGEPVLLNADNINWNEPVIITEGEIDCMSVWQSGYKNVVSIPLGVKNFEWVDVHWDDIEKCKEFIVCGDNDEAGIKFNEECIKKFGVNRVKLIQNTHNDLNILLYKESEEGVKKVLEAAEFEKIDGLIELSEVDKWELQTSSEDAEDAENSKDDRIDSGFKLLNGLIGGFNPSGLIILSGKRGEGKSTLASQFILDAISNNTACCVYSGELTKELFKHWLFLQIIGKHSKTKFDTMREKNVEYVPDEYYEVLNEWIKNKLYIYDNTVLERKTLKEASILEIFKYAAKRHDCKLFLIDNLMTARNQFEGGYDFYKNQGEFIGSFKTFANDYNVSVIFVAHPKKTDNNSDFGNDDIAGSSENTDRADVVLKITRLNEEDVQRYRFSSVLTVLKNRLYGELGSIKLDFDSSSKRFIEKGQTMKEYIDLSKVTKIEKPITFDDCPF
jgi:twinkle protein